MIIFFFASYPSLFSSTDDKGDSYYAVIYLTAGFVYDAGSSDFINTYNEVFGGKESHFKSSPTFGAGMKIEFFENFRIGLAANYYYGEIQDTYEQSITKDGGLKRYISQEFNISALPILLTFEYIPFYEDQFKTFIGIGAGVTLKETYWREFLNSELKTDTRVGGIHYDGSQISPAGRFFTGIELGFDSREKRSFLGSLIFGINISTEFIGTDLYSSVKYQFDGAYPDFNQKTGLMPVYIGFDLALSFNFRTKSKKTEKYLL